MPILPLPFIIALEVLARAIRWEIKGIQIKKGKVKLFADDMILYIENPEDSTEKLVRNDKFSKISGYKVNRQKLVTLLCCNNELYKKGIF